MLNPFRNYGQTHDEMERMMDAIFRRLAPHPGRSHTTGWLPSIDVLRQDGDLVVRAELPGVKQEDIDLTLENNVLTISGEHEAEEQEEERGGYYVRERRHGSFSRSVPLSEGISESNIRARFENGVLEVVMEGAGALEEPRNIQIEGEGGGSSA